MKMYILIGIIFFLMLNNSWAKLRNGYEKDIQYVREKLEIHNTTLHTNGNLSASEKRHLRIRIRSLKSFQSYYELTEQLLKQFKYISPTLFNSIDSLRDAKGRFTDVYVKLIPREESVIMAGGVTHMAPSAHDKDACISEYGKYSVSIKIWLFGESLSALAHELGHVHYQVPNLKSYHAYYKNQYLPWLVESNHIGHALDDQSGREATTFQKRFRKDYVNQLKQKSDVAHFESSFVLMEEIKKKFNDNQLSVAR